MSARLMRIEHLARLRYIFLGAILAASCGGDSPAPQTPSSGGGGGSGSGVSVTGTEKIGWDQVANSASELTHFRYIAYVDDVPQVLANATCGTSSTNGAFACTATMPKMSIGSHRFELATEEIDGQLRMSSRSPVLLLNVVAPRTVAAAGQVVPTATTVDGIQLVVETLATGLSAPSAIVPAADGRVFAAVRDGRILVWQSGALRSTPAFELGDAAQTSDIGLIDLAIDPDFASNGRVFVAYTARDQGGEFVNRIIRLRDANGVFGQAAVILEDRAPSAPQRPPRIRVDADHTVYVAFPTTNQEAAESFGSYAGKVLRITEDGTTPRDNEGSTPVISSGEALVGGFDWQSTTRRLWIAGRDWQNRDFVRDLRISASAATFESPVDPSGAAFYRGKVIGGFANDLFISALTGRHLRRLHFSKTDPARIEITERLLDQEYGRISDVSVGTDGALYIATSDAGTASAGANGDVLLRVTQASGR